MKKVIYICISLTLLFCFHSYLIYAVLDVVPYWEKEISIPVLAQMKPAVVLTLDAEAAILMEEDTGTILYTKNEHEKLRPASVTKVMTILLIMEALDRGEIHLADKVPCSKNARQMGGSQIWLNESEELTVDEMLKAICVVSANDCCVAMAEFLGGTEESFVQKMNQRAKELGMQETTFRNCHGIDEEGHLTSAYDIALMSRELSKKHPKIHNYTKIWMDTLRDGKSELVNTNKLVRFYAGCTGLKTGSTSLAMFNLSATATRNDLNLIGVVMKGTTSQNRFDDAKKLLDYGFANFSSKVIVHEGDAITTIPVLKANREEINLIAENDFSLLVAKGEENQIRTEIELEENVSAPIVYRQKLGVEKIFLGEELKGEVSLLASEAVERKGITDYFKHLCGAL